MEQCKVIRIIVEAATDTAIKIVCFQLGHLCCKDGYETG